MKAEAQHLIRERAGTQTQAGRAQAGPVFPWLGILWASKGRDGPGGVNSPAQEAGWGALEKQPDGSTRETAGPGEGL